MQSKTSWIILVFIVLSIIFLNIFLSRNPSTDIGPKNFIEKIRKENKIGFDSLNRSIIYENDLRNRIQINIKTRNFKTAYELMDSLPDFGKKATLHLYKGMIYEAENNYSEALKEYDAALREDVNPLFLEYRASLFIRTNKIEQAILDYKQAYSINHYYCLHVAKAYELIKKRDSALKYYNIYTEYYPNDSIVKAKLKFL